MTTHDIDGRDVIVCPYCGHEHGDCDECYTGGDLDCDGCGRIFHYEAEHTVTYSTSCITGEHRYGMWLDVGGTVYRRCEVCEAVQLLEAGK